MMALVTICSLSYSGYVTYILIRESSHDLALQRLSLNLGTAASWQAVDEYMSNHLKPGMPRQKVLELFDKAGPYVLTETGDCEVIEFKPGIFNITSYILRACYEKDTARSLKHFTFEND